MIDAYTEAQRIVALWNEGEKASALLRLERLLEGQDFTDALLAALPPRDLMSYLVIDTDHKDPSGETFRVTVRR